MPTLDLPGPCPVPYPQYNHILLGPASGQRLTPEPIQRLFVLALANDVLAVLGHQASVAPLPMPLDLKCNVLPFTAASSFDEA